MRYAFVFVLIQFWAAIASAEDHQVSHKDYVLGNSLLTLYHEFGHALVDNLNLPVLGREEDAVDFFSILMIENKFHSKVITQSQEVQLDDFLWSTADVWLAYAESEEGEESNFASEHSLDMQRFNSHICLVYGSDPDFYSNLIQDFELEETEFENCEDRFSRIEASWMSVLEPSLQQGSDPNDDNEILVFIHEPNNPELKPFFDWVRNWPWLVDLQTSLSSTLILPKPITLSITECGEPNAFFDSEDNGITLCYELMAEYSEFYHQLQ